MATVFPSIGQWFKRPNGTLLEVVAIDEDNKAIEVQFFDVSKEEVPTMALYIVADECISCGDCEPECPTSSIYERRHRRPAVLFRPVVVRTPGIEAVWWFRQPGLESCTV